MDRSEYRRSCQQGTSSEIPYRIKTLFHNADGAKPILPRQLELIHTSPNIYFVRNFLTEIEIEYFDKMCTQDHKAFKHSFTEDELQQEVVSEERTSTYTYLTKGQDATIRSLEHRAAEIAGLTSDCLEPLQVVAYTAGQKFDTHHDAGTLADDGSVELVPPRRLTTLLLYLNTLPLVQGHTEFPDLKLSVRPERGCGVLFCNVLPDGQPDPRTIHRACPVDGNLRKYAINVWMTDSSFQSLACLRKKESKKGGASASKSSKPFTLENGVFSIADRAAREHESAPKPSQEKERRAAAKHPPPQPKASTASDTEDEESNVMKWSTRGPPGVIGMQVAAPFFLWVEADTQGEAPAKKKRKRVKANFCGTVTHYAKDPTSGKCFYRVFYPQDGETEDIDGDKLADSVELRGKIERGEEREGFQ